MRRASSVRRAGVALIGGSLLAAGLAVAGPSPAAHAAADPAPAADAASWLAGELVDGALQSSFGGPDWGLSIDAAFAFQEVGGHDAEISSIRDALAAHIGDYVTGEAFGDAGSTYAGATAKATVFADSVGSDPSAFGGDDLVARLEGTVQSSGRIQDVSTYGDYANVIGQTFAARALTEQSSAQATAAVDFLLTQQCAAGWFRQDFTHEGADPANFDPGVATDASCTADAASTPNVDATALAVIVLQPLATSDQDVAASLDKAVAWLKSKQAADGSLRLGSIAANANSTSLGAWAFRLAGADGAAAKAARWVRSLQLGGTVCDGKASADAGAVTYTPADYEAAVADGISDRAKVARVATQAVPALLAAPGATTNLKLGGSPRFLDGGTKQVLSPSGLAPGERGCLRIGGSRASVVGDAAGDATAAVPVPDRTKDVTVSVQAGNQAVGTPAVALAGKRLPVDLRASVRPRGTQRVAVSGLWPGERVVVRNEGDVVARGHADADGTFVARFTVARTTGDDRVAVRGQFADRRGSASYQVG